MATSSSSRERSSGLGVQLGQALAGAGATPVLAARRADRLEALTARHPAARTRSPAT